MVTSDGATAYAANGWAVGIARELSSAYALMIDARPLAWYCSLRQATTCS